MHYFMFLVNLSSPLRVLLNSSHLELNFPGNGLMCTPKIPIFDRNSWRGFVDETCFFFSVQESMNTDQSAPVEVSFTLQEKLSLDFSLHGHFLSRDTWFEFIRNTICLE